VIIKKREEMQFGVPKELGIPYTREEK